MPTCGSSGFADPIKLIRWTPATLGLGIDNIRTKIADLRELGFADPVKMIEVSPEILGLTLVNIQSKIADLRNLGFDDPIKVISVPSVYFASSHRHRPR